MSLPLVFHPDVQDDVDKVYRWYEQQRQGLGDDFLTNPRIHQVIYRDVRRGLPKRFPFGVFYRAHADRVEVIAVYDNRRDPRGWQSRA